MPRLDEAKFARLERELRKEPMAHGWPDQVWTLSRIKTLIGRRFHLTCTVQGVHLLLRRHGWTRQVPARRAVAGWVKDTRPRVEVPRRRWLSNTAFTTVDHPVRTVSRGLRKIQYRNDIIDGCLTGTWLQPHPT